MDPALPLLPGTAPISPSPSAIVPTASAMKPSIMIHGYRPSSAASALMSSRRGL